MVSTWLVRNICRSCVAWRGVQRVCEKGYGFCEGGKGTHVEERSRETHEGARRAAMNKTTSYKLVGWVRDW
jgi:hypothetical protein